MGNTVTSMLVMLKAAIANYSLFIATNNIVTRDLAAVHYCSLQSVQYCM